MVFIKKLTLLVFLAVTSVFAQSAPGLASVKKGKGAAITGRYLGLHDNATGTVSLMDKDEKTLLWSDEVGYRSLLFGAVKRGRQRKVADRLISKFKKALDGK
jgi:hypothetical protein